MARGRDSRGASNLQHHRQHLPRKYPAAQTLPHLHPYRRGKSWKLLTAIIKFGGETPHTLHDWFLYSRAGWQYALKHVQSLLNNTDGVGPILVYSTSVMLTWVYNICIVHNVAVLDCVPVACPRAFSGQRPVSFVFLLGGNYTGQNNFLFPPSLQSFSSLPPPPPASLSADTNYLTTRATTVFTTGLVTV